MYGCTRCCSSFVLEIALRNAAHLGPHVLPSFTLSADSSVNQRISHPTRSSPMYPAFRSYPRPVQPVHPDRRGMFYRFYDRYRIFNDRRDRPFPFRFYCESSFAHFQNIKKREFINIYIYLFYCYPFFFSFIGS